MIKYRRVLLKLSGEALEGSRGAGIEARTLGLVAGELAEVARLGAEVAVVIGGGNFFRGLSGLAEIGIERSTGDTIGMLATVMNCLAMGDALEQRGQRACVLTAVGMGPVAERFSRRRAVAALEAGQVVLLAGGTGNPYFTTDTAAALRALEIGAEVLLKATKVDGIYDKDPVKHPDASRFAHLGYQEVLDRRLQVTDLTAITLCRENRLPLVVFDLAGEGNIRRVVEGDPSVGSWVEGD
jgi:uridylate kinase